MEKLAALDTAGDKFHVHNRHVYWWRDGGYSEARWTWVRMQVPLAGSADWVRKISGGASLEKVTGIGFTFDSWESDPFTMWLDGISFE